MSIRPRSNAADSVRVGVGIGTCTSRSSLPRPQDSIIASRCAEHVAASDGTQHERVVAGVQCDHLPAGSFGFWTRSPKSTSRVVIVVSLCCPVMTPPGTHLSSPASLVTGASHVAAPAAWHERGSKVLWRGWWAECDPASGPTSPADASGFGCCPCRRSCKPKRPAPHAVVRRSPASIMCDTPCKFEWWSNIPVRIGSRDDWQRTNGFHRARVNVTIQCVASTTTIAGGVNVNIPVQLH